MSRVQAVGFKHFNDAIDGQQFNVLTIFTLAPLQRQDASMSGMSGVDNKCDPVLVSKLQAIFPAGSRKVVALDIESERRAKGKGQFEDIIINVTPVPDAAAQK